MSAINLYATLTDFKNYVTPIGQTPDTTTSDDTTLTNILEAVSRQAFDALCGGRVFYPRYETRYFDVPVYNQQILLDDDLLEAITVTNGDGSSVSTSNLIFDDANNPPYWSIRMKGSANLQWQASAAGDTENVIAVYGVWGWREHYPQRGWVSGGTLASAISNTTTLAFTMNAQHTIVAGHIVKIGSEIYNVATVTSNTVTPYARGDNGSTAATHAADSVVYIWQVESAVNNAVLQIAQTVDANRSGQSSAGDITVTAAGVVIRPKEIGPLAAKIIDQLTRKP